MSSSSTSTSAVVERRGPRILILGGSYAGLSTVTTLLKVCDGKALHDGVQAIEFPDTAPLKPKIRPEITILDERDGFFHTMGAPLAHVDRRYVPKAWYRFRDIPSLQRVSFLRGTVTSVNFGTKTAEYRALEEEEEEEEATGKSTGEREGEESAGVIRQLEYDYLVAATGTRRGWPVVPTSLSRAGYLRAALENIDSIESNSDFVVVGGGAVGVEMAGELKHAFPQKHMVLVHSRDRLLSSEPLPDAFKLRARELLQQAGVEVLLNRRVLGTEDIDVGGKKKVKVTLSDGDVITTGKVISTIVRHEFSTKYLPPSVLTDAGCVKARPNLSIDSDLPNSCCHFAVGDIVEHSCIKRVGGAYLMGQVAAVNLAIKMLGKDNDNDDSDNTRKHVEFPSFPPMMALAIADNALAYRPMPGTPGEGMSEGQEVKRMLFGEDLALSSVVEHLGLAPVPN